MNIEQPTAVPCTTPISHRPVQQEIVDDETKVVFVRNTCGDCGRWISDRTIAN